MQRLRAVLPDLSKKDNRIIACALFVQETFPPPTILVTKDVNVQLKPVAVGLESQDYLNDKVPESPDEDSYQRIPVSVYELQRFASEGEFGLAVDLSKTLAINEYILLVSPEGKTMPARYYGGVVVRRLRIPESVKAPGGIPIRARNLEQQFFMDALLDDNISLITCFGKAGTARRCCRLCALCTRCATNRAATMAWRSPAQSLRSARISAILPGSLEEKMRPWLQPYYDALEVLMPTTPKEPQFIGKKAAEEKEGGGSAAAGRAHAGGNGHANGVGVKPYERLIKNGTVEIEALCFIRGRSIARRFFILDEAQQLTPHEVKTVITRISEGSKIVLIGDPAQIDNPYVDSRSNGLCFAITDEGPAMPPTSS